MAQVPTSFADRFSDWYAKESTTSNYDLFLRLPAFAYFGLVVWVQLGALLDIVLAGNDLPFGIWASSLASRAAGLSVALIFAALTLLRSKPVARAKGLTPRLVAIAGAGFMFSMVFLERAAPSMGWDLASAVLMTVGGVLTAVVVLRLGRSFSTMAEARRLVVSGPYRYVRHPLYLAEEITILGLLLQFRSWGALVLVVMQFGLQVWRMHNEERVLAETFPEYADYARSTSRIVPGVY